MENAHEGGPASPPAPGGILSGVKSRALEAVDQRKGDAASTLGTVAEALRDAAHRLEGEAGPLGGYAQGAAEQVDKVARYVREEDVEGLRRDAETFARRHPEAFLGGAVLAGLLAARFLKSSGRRAGTETGGI